MLQQASAQQANGHVAHLSLVLTITQSATVQRHCPRCRVNRDFVSGGKFRVNAQKKLIDVWLIFRCATCDQTWNHPIHERKSVRAIPAAELDALMRNDPALAARHALAAARLAGSGSITDADLRREVIVPASGATAELLISIALPEPGSLRLDRVLAWGLGIERAEIPRLPLGVAPRALRRPAIDGQQIRLDLTHCSPEQAEKYLAMLR